MLCYRHPRVETNLSCGRCERPICVKCSVPGPAGIRCPECASLRSSPLYKVSAGRLALTTLAALIVGTVGAVILFSVSFFVLLIGPGYGGLVAEVVLRASGRKRGPALEAIGVGSIIVGAIIAIGSQIAWLNPALHALRSAPGPILTAFMPMLVWPLIGIALAVSACFTRLRYH